MELTYVFFVNSILLGVGLAMDAFSVSLANGLNEPKMQVGKMTCVAGVFAFFQFLMPMIGWVCVHTVAAHFAVFEQFIPWIALILLSFIGGKMLLEGLQHKDGDEEEAAAVGLTALLVQGVATSIDALSVGFTIATHTFLGALTACIIIGVITFALCFAGVCIGKKAGSKLSNKAGIFGGIILILIGLEIFISSWF